MPEAVTNFYFQLDLFAFGVFKPRDTVELAAVSRNVLIKTEAQVYLNSVSRLT